MKPEKKSRSATALALLGAAFLISGCGRANNLPVATAPVISNPTVPGLGGFGGGCIPVSQPISFTAQNLYFSWSSIVAGLLPGANQQVGQVMIGGAAMVGGGPFQRSGVDGTISMNITPLYTAFAGNFPMGYPNNIYPGAIPNQYSNFSGANYGFGFGGVGGFGMTPQMAMAQGSLMISPLTQQDIMNTAMLGGFGPIPGMTGVLPGTMPGMIPGAGVYSPIGINPPNLMANSVCVSGIAINVGHYNGLIYGGRVYLYLNNSPRGYILYF